MSELRNVSHNKYATSFKPRFWTAVVLLNSDADCFHKSSRSRLLTVKVSTVSQRGYQKVTFDMHEDFCVRIREKKLFLHTSSNLT